MKRKGCLGSTVLLLIFLSTPILGCCASSQRCLQSDGTNASANPLEVYESVRRLGERRALRDLKRDTPRWRTFIDGLSCGEQAWIDLAMLFVPHATDARKQEIRASLEEALIQAPERVLLAVAGSTTVLRMACGPSVHLSYDLAASSLNERQNVVMSLYQQERSGPYASLDKTIDGCLDLLEKAERDLAKRSENCRRNDK